MNRISLLADVVRDALKLLFAIAIYALGLYVTDIGCIVRFVTGVSCPGCGLTRAWLCALRFDFDAALAYHPLFWAVPLVVLAAIAYDCACRPSFAADPSVRRMRTVLRVVLVLALIAFVSVWLIRLCSPKDAALLLSAVPGYVPEDIVGIAWLDA